MKKTFAALAAAAALTTATVPAVNAMEQEFNMLTGAVYNALSGIGADTDGIGELTIGQIAQIKGILDSGDLSNDEKKDRVAAIMAQ